MLLQLLHSGLECIWPVHTYKEEGCEGQTPPSTPACVISLVALDPLPLPPSVVSSSFRFFFYTFSSFSRLPSPFLLFTPVSSSYFTSSSSSLCLLISSITIYSSLHPFPFHLFPPPSYPLFILRCPQAYLWPFTPPSHPHHHHHYTLIITTTTPSPSPTHHTPSSSPQHHQHSPTLIMHSHHHTLPTSPPYIPCHVYANLVYLNLHTPLFIPSWYSCMGVPPSLTPYWCIGLPFIGRCCLFVSICVCVCNGYRLPLLGCLWSIGICWCLLSTCR